MAPTAATICAVSLALVVGAAELRRGPKPQTAVPILDGSGAVMSVRTDTALRTSRAPASVGEGRVAQPVRVLTPVGMVYIPRGFHADDGAFDVVVHFHGAPNRVESALDRAQVDAVLLTVNLGVRSGAYEQAYELPVMIDTALATVRATVGKRVGIRAPRVRRLALSAWSAGYGAVVRLLARPAIADRVDAVLLADGMHAGYASASGHAIDAGRMAPFVAFADRAAIGDALMAVTHSAIPTPGYASTTETASYLVEQVGAEETDAREIGPRGMILTSKADKGGLHVRGFAGTTKQAHCDHLLGIGETLFPLLHERWAAALR